MTLDLREKPEESIKDVLRVRPMSTLSKQFNIEHASRVEVVLLHFNDELFPQFSKVKEDLAKDLFIFTDRSENATVDLLRLEGEGSSG